jgi:hypothetical protein
MQTAMLNFPNVRGDVGMCSNRTIVRDIHIHLLVLHASILLFQTIHFFTLSQCLKDQTPHAYVRVKFPFTNVGPHDAS